MSDNNKDTDPRGNNRRDILKRMAATSALVGGSSLASSTATGKNETSNANPSSKGRGIGVPKDNVIRGENGEVLGYETPEVKINEPTIAEGGKARREARGMMSNNEVKDIRDWFQERGLRPNVKDAFALELSVSDKVPNADYDADKINNSDPIVVTIPFVPTGKDEGKGGILKVMMVNDGPRRVVAGALGGYATKADEGAHVQVLGRKEGEVAVIHEENKAEEEFTSSGYFKCLACTLTTDQLCNIAYGVVGLQVCLGACAAAGPAWLPCSVVCGAIVGISVLVMCAITADAFCSYNLNFCNKPKFA